MDPEDLELILAELRRYSDRQSEQMKMLTDGFDRIFERMDRVASRLAVADPPRPVLGDHGGEDDFTSAAAQAVPAEDISVVADEAMLEPGVTFFPADGVVPSPSQPAQPQVPSAPPSSPPSTTISSSPPRTTDAMDCFKGAECQCDTFNMFDEMPPSSWWSPSRILEVKIHRVLYPISEKVIRQVFDPFGMVDEVQVHESSDHVGAIVVFQLKNDALEAFGELHGRNIYDGCCQLDVKFGLSREVEPTLVTSCSTSICTTASGIPASFTEDVTSLASQDISSCVQVGSTKFLDISIGIPGLAAASVEQSPLPTVTREVMHDLAVDVVAMGNGIVNMVQPAVVLDVVACSVVNELQEMAVLTNIKEHVPSVVPSIGSNDSLLTAEIIMLPPFHQVAQQQRGHVSGFQSSTSHSGSDIQQAAQADFNKQGNTTNSVQWQTIFDPCKFYNSYWWILCFIGRLHVPVTSWYQGKPCAKLGTWKAPKPPWLYYSLMCSFSHFAEIFSAAMIWKQPWPPPVQWIMQIDGALLRPTPWPSFGYHAVDMESENFLTFNAILMINAQGFHLSWLRVKLMDFRLHKQFRLSLEERNNSIVLQLMIDMTMIQSDTSVLPMMKKDVVVGLSSGVSGQHLLQFSFLIYMTVVLYNTSAARKWRSDFLAAKGVSLSTIWEIGTVKLKLPYATPGPASRIHDATQNSPNQLDYLVLAMQLSMGMSRSSQLY